MLRACIFVKPSMQMSCWSKHRDVKPLKSPMPAGVKLFVWDSESFGNPT